MSRIGKLFGVLKPPVFQADEGRREPQVAVARKVPKKREPVLADSGWQEIKESLQAEVSGAQPGISPED